ncbi:meprin and TRAF domain-containing protein [Tieghemostelium lacteum]|uniref:ubiquitinyl hydrolase 1 n=1 Tax=Tieghemostelium lacteum TaxID=361077 RepID=A0A152A6V3_TIELA|nr:meprin and TRAF domain-containing protein [Tieghemostelium lacteum]|eukprot:KYR01948.1 meprin and TRAF domain-containing protein [Tieghemostelium lacteum]
MTQNATTIQSDNIPIETNKPIVKSEINTPIQTNKPNTTQPNQQTNDVNGTANNNESTTTNTNTPVVVTTNAPKPQTKFTIEVKDWSKKDSPFYSEAHTLWDLTWKLYIFPKGNVPDQLSLFLDVAEARQPTFPGVRVSFTLEVVNQKKPDCNIRKPSDRVLNQRNCDWGFNSFIALSQLNNPESGFIKDDTLLINVEVIQANIISNQMYDSKKYTGYVGLQNQGATCYMNSLLQSLYLISPFRKAVYEIPTQTDESTKSISLALQKIFYKLQFGDKAVATKDLTTSFGWNTMDIFIQHDVQELNRVLCDKINDKMKGTSSEGTIDNLFRGKIKNFIKCENVDYESKSDEFFYDLSLNVKGCKDLVKSFDKYTEVERLDGNNQYFAEGFGLQNANKGVKFLSFPPVLHLHLKRFEYDYDKDENVKINDKFTFPEVLDLNPFLDDDADKEIDNTYNLQGVLVHSGDLHNGHYYVFLKNKDGEWLKFDDDEVTKSNFDVVSDSSFGNDLSGARQSNNAYMLVYFRSEEYSDLLKPIESEEISEHLKQKIDKDDIRENEQLIPIKITRDEDFFNHHSFDLVDFEKFPIKWIKKTADPMTIGHLKKQITAIYGIPQERQRLWNWTKRRNNTIRIDIFPESDDTNLQFIKERLGEWKFHLEISYLPRLTSQQQQTSNGLLTNLTNNPFNSGNNNNNNSNNGNSNQSGGGLGGNANGLDNNALFIPITKEKENHAVLFFKYFDAQNNLLSFVGSRVIDVNSKISSIVPFLNQLTGLPLNSSLLLFEEVTHVHMKVDPIRLNETFAHFKIGNGDIIVFQRQVPLLKKPINSLPTLLEYYHNIINTIIVTLKQVDHENQKIHTPFKLQLSKLMKYSEITNKIAQHITANAEYIRLMSNSNSRFDSTPITPIKPNDNIPLYDMLIANNKVTDQLYFEILNIPVKECEFKKNFKISFTRPVVGENQLSSIWVNKSGQVKEIIQEFITTSDIFNSKSMVSNDTTTTQPDNTQLMKKIRLLEIKNHRIEKALKMDDQVLSIYEHSSLRAEVISDEEASLPTSGPDRLIQIVHFNRDHNINHYHGIPFVIIFKPHEKVSLFRQRIQQKLPMISQKDFSRWKLAIIKGDKIDYLQEDSEMPNIDWSLSYTFIGLDHPNTSKSVQQRAIKILG